MGLVVEDEDRRPATLAVAEHPPQERRVALVVLRLLHRERRQLCRRASSPRRRSRTPPSSPAAECRSGVVLGRHLDRADLLHRRARACTTWADLPFTSPSSRRSRLCQLVTNTSPRRRSGIRCSGTSCRVRYRVNSSRLGINSCSRSRIVTFGQTISTVSEYCGGLRIRHLVEDRPRRQHPHHRGLAGAGGHLERVALERLVARLLRGRARLVHRDR